MVRMTVSIYFNYTPRYFRNVYILYKQDILYQIIVYIRYLSLVHILVFMHVIIYYETCVLSLLAGTLA